MTRWLAAPGLLLCLLAAPVHAGVCLDDDEIKGYVEELERHAKGGDEPQGYWPLCVRPGDKLAARVAKACAKVVERHAAAKAPSATHSECVRWLVSSGERAVGTYDLVAALLSARWGLFDYEVSANLAALAESGDARVRGFVADKLREHLAAVRAKPLRGWKAKSWTKWQVAGLAALRKLGDPSDVALIDELVAASKDKQVRRAADKAKKEIAARAGK